MTEEFCICSSICVDNKEKPCWEVVNETGFTEVLSGLQP